MNEDFVVWNDSYSVGHDGMDYQHKDLVKMTDELFKLCKSEKDSNNVAFLVAIKKAAAYAKIHFSDEERYMVRASYPDLNRHQGEHEQFVQTVEEALRKFEARENAPIEMARFLKNWLLNHIAKSDKQYAPYFAKL